MRVLGKRESDGTNRYTILVSQSVNFRTKLIAILNVKRETTFYLPEPNKDFLEIMEPFVLARTSDDGITLKVSLTLEEAIKLLKGLGYGLTEN